MMVMQGPWYDSCHSLSSVKVITFCFHLELIGWNWNCNLCCVNSHKCVLFTCIVRVDCVDRNHHETALSKHILLYGTIQINISGILGSLIVCLAKCVQQKVIIIVGHAYTHTHTALATAPKLMNQTQQLQKAKVATFVNELYVECNCVLSSFSLKCKWTDVSSLINIINCIACTMWISLGLSQG